MFKNLFIFVAVLCCCNNVNAQNVFNPNDSIATYNSSAAAGSVNNPNQPPYFVMSSWVRSAKLAWNTSNFKSYIWNGLNFRLRFPNNYNASNAGKYPVIVFYHGGGEAGGMYDNESQLTWGAQVFEQRINNGEWNGFLIFPQEPVIGWNDFQFSRIVSVLDTLQKYNNADPDRVISMGLSAGGFGALNFASLHPDRVALVAAASPPQAVSLNDNVSNWVHVPVWFANGGLDLNPDPFSSQRFYTGFRNAGGNIYQSYFVNDGHTSWVDMWNMKNATGAFMGDVYWANAHKAQPLVYFQNQQFCEGDPIAARMGITAGYYSYEWQRDGAVIAEATGNEYTATQAGTYRVRFMRVAGGVWSDWTPNPVVINTKKCATDTLFAEHFTTDNYYSSTLAYSNGNFTCQNGIMTSGTDLFTQDAAGVQGGRFLISFTSTKDTLCTYKAGDLVWSTPNAIYVSPSTNYEFNFYVGSQNSISPAQLAPTINGTALITGYVTVTGTGNASWKKFTYTWNSGSATSAVLGIINRSAATTGNDFAIDDISLRMQQQLLINTLPVTWLGVSAKLSGSEVAITWDVSNEINVNNYIVQRSVDGLSFTNAAVVNANAVTSVEKEYAAIDRLPQKGNNYYRILQTDKDGKYTYSKTVLVNVSEAGGVTVWPNPAATTVNIQSGQPMLRLQCYNNNGQLMFDAKPSAGMYAIPVQQWAPGVYYIKITGSSATTQSRFIKQ